MYPRHFTLIAAVAALVVSALPLDAQIRGSELSRITQTVDGTTISVTYSRPHARGREPVFGVIVDWGHIWTPGANWATTFEFSKDVEINGVSVPEGKYSVWMITDSEEWDIILDPRDSVFHTMRPELREEQIRFSATPQVIIHVEALTFSFPEVRADGVDMVFSWGTISLPMRVVVQPSQTLTVEADVAAPYPGVYDVEWVGPPPEGGPKAERPRLHSRMELTYSGGYLTALWDLGGNAVNESGVVEVMMVPVTAFVFHPGWMQDGQLFETETDLWVEFSVENGMATGFQIRDGIADLVIWEGTRVDQSEELQIARAVLAAPAEFRERAEVREWNDEGVLVTIREGSG